MKHLSPEEVTLKETTPEELALIAKKAATNALITHAIEVARNWSLEYSKDYKSFKSNH